jgi:hypothetical protein
LDADNLYAPRPLAGWFKPAAIASVLFMMLGCVSYLMQVMTDPATLPLDQRVMIEAAPTWMWTAFAIAVWAGLAGAVLLLLRKALAVPILGVSLIAVLVQFSAYFLVPRLRESMSSDELLIPIIIVALTWTIFWFAWHSRKRAWLS